MKYHLLSSAVGVTTEPGVEVEFTVTEYEPSVDSATIGESRIRLGAKTADGTSWPYLLSFADWGTVCALRDALENAIIEHDVMGAGG